MSPPGGEPGAGGPPPLPRLDPDAAGGERRPGGEDAGLAAGEAPIEERQPAEGERGPTEGEQAPRGGDRQPRPVIDTRRYRWLAGIIGVVLIAGLSAYQLISHGTTSMGVPAGHRLHLFAAPLAASDLNGDPNAHPTCAQSRHDPRALNLCLLAARGPMVVSFFVTGASQCERQVSALQTLAARYPAVQFAAVAVNAGHTAAAAAVRRHHWTIPVAYDRDGTVQGLYDVVACPMVEMAQRGGTVRTRLIGNHWQTAAALAPYVARLG